MQVEQSQRWPIDVALPVVGGQPVEPDVERFVMLVGERHGTDDPQVAALLAWKRYAYNVALPVADAWEPHRLVPDVGLGNVVVSIVDDEPFLRLAVVEARWYNRDAPEGAALTPLRAHHLDLVADRFRAIGRIGRRALDAFTAATVVSAVSNASRERDPFASVDDLLGGLGGSLARMIEVAELTTPEGHCVPMALRTACCLQYKTPAGGYCSTCNLIDDDQRTRQLAAHGYGWGRRPRPPEAPGP
ncbi:MAG: (2Fe-2S)-binding protein [Acidimicrobiales bacterium]